MKQQTKAPSTSIPVKVGDKFKSKHFEMDAEIFKIIPDENRAEVLLKAKDGHEWLEKDWNLQHTIWGFENGEYYAVSSIPVKEGQEVLDITKGEWRVDKEKPCIVRVNEYVRLIQTLEVGNCPSVGDYEYFVDREGEANAKAICTAVNGTYGKGFDPSKMEELYKALAIAHKNLQGQNCFLSQPEWEQIETALTNAKL